MTENDVLSFIKRRLTGGVLSLEIEDKVILDLIKEAHQKALPYISDTKEETVAVASEIDLTEYGFADVVEVKSTVEPLEISFSDSYLDRSVKILTKGLTERVIQRSLIQYKDIDFDFINGKLYLDLDDIDTTTVTVEGIVEVELLKIKDKKALDWIQRYALASTKEVLGRIRSKYKPQGVPVELDGEALLQESKEEMEILLRELQDNSFGIYHIVR